MKRNSSAGSCPHPSHHAVFQGMQACNLWVHRNPCSSELHIAGVSVLWSARICFLCSSRKAWDPEGWQCPSPSFLVMPFQAEKLNFLVGAWGKVVLTQEKKKVEGKSSLSSRTCYHGQNCTWVFVLGVFSWLSSGFQILLEKRKHLAQGLRWNLGQLYKYSDLTN